VAAPIVDEHAPVAHLHGLRIEAARRRPSEPRAFEREPTAMTRAAELSRIRAPVDRAGGVRARSIERTHLLAAAHEVERDARAFVTPRVGATQGQGRAMWLAFAKLGQGAGIDHCAVVACARADEIAKTGHGVDGSERGRRAAEDEREEPAPSLSHGVHACAPSWTPRSPRERRPACGASTATTRRPRRT